MEAKLVIVFTYFFLLSFSFFFVKLQFKAASVDAKLAIVFIDFFGPGGFCVLPEVADGSEAGHCFHPGI